MRKSFKIVAITVGLLFIISLSINIVFAVGQSAEPGSDQDPIVSKSYVDAVVGELTAKIQSLLEQNEILKNQNIQLTTRVTTQEQAVKAVQEELKAVKSGIAAGTGTSGSTGNSGGTATKPATSLGKGVVNVAVLNVRKQATVNSDRVAQVVKNEILTLEAKNGDWYKITTSKGTSGFVMGIYVTVKK